jgi:hypothetical protein
MEVGVAELSNVSAAALCERAEALALAESP